MRQVLNPLLYACESALIFVQSSLYLAPPSYPFVIARFETISPKVHTKTGTTITSSLLSRCIRRRKRYFCRFTPGSDLQSLLGRQSRWYGYLQSLPEAAPDLPLFWKQETTESFDEDGESAFRWLQGTEVDRLRSRRKAGALPIVSEMPHSG